MKSLNSFLKPILSFNSLAIAINAALFALPAFADDLNVDTAKNDIEVMTITNQRYNRELMDNQNLAQGKTSEVDLANWLTSVPGANINSNGPVTGIAQYRGLYGDRLAISLDGHPVIGAGPNAMDTPLSYSTPLIVDSMTVYRGIAPISAAMNTLGGAIDVKMRKAEVINTSNVDVFGDLQVGYRSNNKAKTVSAVTNVAKDDIAVMVYGNSQVGDSMQSGDGITITPTDFDKVQLGSDIRYMHNDTSVGLSYNYTQTNDSGTPALPMDIEYIKSHRLSLDGSFAINNWQAEWLLGYIDADHGMTNFLMRENNNMAKYRRNNATAITRNFKFTLLKEYSFGEITLGTDGYFASHDSVITNPNNAMFAVVNFADVEDNRYAIFSQWTNTYAKTDVQLGIRLKRAESKAKEVSTSMAMMPSMMGEISKNLMINFNNADRNVADNNIDIALSTQTKLNDRLSLYVGAGLKNRAPSYQERYLWTPMESTGGLADGHTYVGNINLNSETAYQFDLGLTYQSRTMMLAPHIFYQNINDYIQGEPLGMADRQTKMLAKMMAADESPLKFTNVDAKLYGMDINGYYKLSEQIKFSGVASYVQGKRRDIDDNLYRIAPLNGQFIISYTSDNFITNLTLVVVSAQHDVSLTNAEQKSSGYGVFNIDAQYFLGNDLTLRFGIDNIFDRQYQNHLGGYNRVKGSAIAVMDRLPAEGLSAWAELNYSF